METILAKIKELIQEPMAKMNIEVVDVVWKVVGKYNYLEITLDRATGLDLDAIVDATNTINPILDEYDLIDEEYILDISSKERGNE